MKCPRLCLSVWAEIFTWGEGSVEVGGQHTCQWYCLHDAVGPVPPETCILTTKKLHTCVYSFTPNVSSSTFWLPICVKKSKYLHFHGCPKNQIFNCFIAKIPKCCSEILGKNSLQKVSAISSSYSFVQRETAPVLTSNIGGKTVLVLGRPSKCLQHWQQRWRKIFWTGLNLLL